MTVNVFAAYQAKAWPHRYVGRVRFRDLAIGGTPTDPKVALAWLKSKFLTNDEAIMKMVSEVMIERSIVDKKAALEIVGDLKLLKGFKRDNVGLYYDGRIIKAGIKEGVAVAHSAGKIPKKSFGEFNASPRSFVAEHVQVEENKIHLLVDGKPVKQYHGIQQRFVTTWRGTGITYEEFVEGAELEFTVIADWLFSDEFWAMVWLSAGEQGLGATRSQGFGRYDVIAWDKVDAVAIKITPARRPAARRKVSA